MAFAAVMGMLVMVLSCSPSVPSNCQSRRHVGPLGRRKTVPYCVENQHQYPLYRFRETSGWRVGQQEVSKRAWCDLFCVNPVSILGCNVLFAAPEAIAIAVHPDHGEVEGIGVERCELSSAQWRRIEGSLPGRPGWVGVTAQDNRKFVNGVLWVLRSGAHWKDLPLGTETGKASTSDSPVGPRPESGRKSSRCCSMTRTTDT